MDCQHLEDSYELFLLGALADAAAEEIHNHLERGCAPCRERVREAARTVYLLCLQTKGARPHPKLKSQLLQCLRKRG